MLVLSLSKIFVVLILIQNVTSQNLYKSKRVRPSYRAISRARLNNKDDSSKLPMISVDKNTDQDKTSIGEPEVIVLKKPSLTNDPIKLKAPAITLEAPLPGNTVEAPVPGNTVEAPVPGTSLNAPLPGTNLEAPLPGNTLEAPPPPPGSKHVTKNRRKILVQKRRLNSENKSDVNNYISTESTKLPIVPEMVILSKVVAVTEAVKYQRNNEPTTEIVTTMKVTRPVINRRRHKYATEIPNLKKAKVTQAVERPRNINYSPIPHTFEKRKEDATSATFVPIVGVENYVYAYNGDYHYSYEGGDGTKAFERGELRPADDKSQPDVVGGYSYKDKDGNDVSLSYTAGKDGYRPVGAHLPTPPPIPPAIQRVLRILATKTTPEPVTESL